MRSVARSRQRCRGGTMSSACAGGLPVAPQIALGLGAMVLLMLGAFRGSANVRIVDYAAIALLVIAGAILLALPAGRLVSFGGSFVVDDFARFLKILALLASAPAIAMWLAYAAREHQER